jgi:hypothetical protein
MDTEKIGNYFLGKTWANGGRDYVWGRVLRDLGDGLVQCGFFEWKPDADESNPFLANITPDQMTGWQFYPTPAALNDAVADLARSLATVAQYDRPKQASKKKSTKRKAAAKPAVKTQGAQTDAQ